MNTTTGYLATSLGELPVVFFRSYAVATAPSSRAGASYRVTITRSFVTCECQGFHYRGKCRHVAAVHEALKPHLTPAAAPAGDPAAAPAQS